ncbi:MAG: hypothetical protein WCG93_07240, partial [Paludibacter sp.]
MEQNSLYWWKVYVLLGATFIMMLVHLHNEKSKNNGYDYAVNYVSNNPKLLAVRNIKSHPAAAKEAIKTKNDDNKLMDKVEVPTNNLTAVNKTKTKRFIASNVKKDETKVTSSVEIDNAKIKKAKAIEVADNVDNTSLQTIDGKNTITDNNGKQLITTTTESDYPVTDNAVYQTQTKNTTANNSTNENTSNTGNSAISTLLNNYNNKNNLVVEGTENNAATGSMVLVDLSKTNLVALNQISENAPIPGTYNGPMHALGNGAGQDGFNAGGGTDNTIT